MRIGKLDTYVLSSRMMLARIVFTKDLRDFVNDCLAKHKNYEDGDLEPLLWSANDPWRERIITENRKTKKERLDDMSFMSYWKIPESLLGEPRSLKYFLFLNTRYDIQERNATEISLCGITPEWYDNFLKIRRAIQNGIDVLRDLA